MLNVLLTTLVRRLCCLHLLTPVGVARLKYVWKLHRWPHFRHPRDLNEKINYLKFYTDTSAWVPLTDKYAVRQIIADKGLADILVTLYGRWTAADAIDWDSLPQRFVMKCNNGSGDIILCNDKDTLDRQLTADYFRRMLQRRFGTESGEPHYAAIPPCIIAEELLDASKQASPSSSLIDYKIWCFNGKPAYIYCCANRHHYHAEVALFDTDWQFLPQYMIFTDHYRRPATLPSRPHTLDRMLDIAARLAEGFPQVRVDLYEVDRRVYFGEMTFTSQGGYMDYFTPDFLRLTGDMTTLPDNAS